MSKTKEDLALENEIKKLRSEYKLKLQTIKDRIFIDAYPVHFFITYNSVAKQQEISTGVAGFYLGNSYTNGYELNRNFWVAAKVIMTDPKAEIIIDGLNGKKLKLSLDIINRILNKIDLETLKLIVND